MTEVEEHYEAIEGLYQKKAGGAPEPIERILSKADLQEIQKTIKQQGADLNREVGAKTQEIQKTTEQLTQYNDDYVKAHDKLEKMKAGQQVRLTGDQEKVIRDMTNKAVDEFMERKPNDPSQMKTVRVHFFTGSENDGGSAMGGEGAGSRDANFQVQLDQRIKILSTQAAKYWGLDPFKVFFLDRDGRVVPDDMMVSDIILPADYNQKQTHMIKGRDYILTLVRAETVITKEDPNEPKGEKWADFTFKREWVEAELLRHRIERGDQTGDIQKIDASQIPSLYDLIRLGHEKKRRRQWDTRCRLFEVFVFVSVLILFHFLLTPEDSWTYNMRLIAKGLEQDLVKFNPGECRNPYAHDFSDISVPGEYYDWVYGPLRRSVLNNSLLSMRNLFVLAVHARRYKNISKSNINICKPKGGGGAGGAAADALSDVGFVSNVSNCSGATAAGNCILGPSFIKANTTHCNDAVGSNTGKKLYGKNATCAMLAPYCTDPLHGNQIKDVCPVTCGWCPQNCAGTPPVVGNSTALLFRGGMAVTNSYEACNNTAMGAFCPLNCSDMYVKSSDYVCTHLGVWSTPKCLAPCPAFTYTDTNSEEQSCPQTKSGGACTKQCPIKQGSTGDQRGYTKTGDYTCTDGKWSPETCVEWKRTNGTCAYNGTEHVSSLELAIQRCENAVNFGGVICEHIALEKCRGAKYWSCLGGFNFQKMRGTPYSDFHLDPPSDCLWVNPGTDIRCKPNVTNMRPAEEGGPCLQGSIIAHGSLCEPMCAAGYEPVYADSGEVYLGNTTCAWGNLTTPFKCQVKPEEEEDCVDAAFADCLNKRVQTIFEFASDNENLWPSCRKPYENEYLDMVETSYLPENAFTLMAGQISSYAGGERIPINITFPAGFDSSIELVDPTWSDPTLRAVAYNIYVYSPTMHGLLIYSMLIEFSVAGHMVPTVKHVLLDIREPSSLEVLVYVMVIVLGVIVFILELRRILKPEFEDEKEKCNIWTLIFSFLPCMFVTSFALRNIRQGTDGVGPLKGMIMNGKNGVINDEDYLSLYMILVYDYYWLMVNLISLLVLNLMFFRYLLTYFPQMLYLTQMVGKVIPPLTVVMFMAASAFACFGAWLYAMFAQFRWDFRDPLQVSMTSAHFAQGGFRNWLDLYWYYPHLWRILMFVTFLIFTLVLKNLPIAVLVSHRKEMRLRENYSYHPMWTGQPNVPDKNGMVTFNPARDGGMRWDKKEPYMPKADKKRLFDAIQAAKK